MSAKEPECFPASVAEWAEILPDWSINDLWAAFRHSVHVWLTWGAKSAGSRVSVEQRAKILDAILLLETRVYRGSEPTAAFPGFEREVRFAHARRAQLGALSGAELAEQCRVVIEEASSRDRSFSAFLTQQQSERSQVARDRVLTRYWYTPALEEFARHYRSKGKGWSSQRAILVLKSKPYHCADGTILSAQDRRIVMTHPDHGLANIAVDQFRRAHWPRAK